MTTSEATREAPLDAIGSGEVTWREMLACAVKVVLFVASIAAAYALVSGPVGLEFDGATLVSILGAGG